MQPKKHEIMDLDFFYRDDIDYLLDLYRICSPSGKEEPMKEYIRKVIKGSEATFTEDDFGNMYITRGSLWHYPCLVAHLDEVHENEDRIIVQQDGKIFSQNGTGIGADDKNGIWIIIQLLKNTDLPLKAIFTVQEERHCEGSNHIDWEFLENVRFLMELDRHGASDFVTVASKIRLSKDKFWDPYLMEEFGYKIAEGGMTDVVNLVLNGLNLPCCNVSVGYYNEHTKEEYTVIDELKNAYNFVEEIFLENSFNLLVI